MQQHFQAVYISTDLNPADIQTWKICSDEMILTGNFCVWYEKFLS